MKKIIVSLLAAFAMIGTIGSVAYAKDVDVWDGTVDTSWYDPADIKTEYTITTAEQFAGLAQLVNGAVSYSPAMENEETADFGYYCGKSATPDESATAKSIPFDDVTFKLAADLDLCAVDEDGELVKLPGGEQLSMAPVGYSTYTPFKGTFDGQGHTIKNMFQGGWDLFGLDYNKKVNLGLFGNVTDATIKNLVVDNFSFNAEMILGGVAGKSSGTTTFENITVKNSVINSSGGWYAGGLIGWAYGNQTIKNVKIAKTVTVAQTSGHYDTAIGGLIGGCNNVDGESIAFINCDVKCKLDVYNDCTANYNTGVYRNCGMIIGGIGEDNELLIDGKKYPDMEAKGITFENVKVYIGEWANYTYCWSYSLPKNCQRIEAGVGYKGVDVSKIADATIDTGKPFDAIIGAENAGDLSNVRGPVNADVMYFLGIDGITLYDEAIIERNEVVLVKATTLSDEAYINGIYYATIEEAIADAEDDDIIVLLKDIDLSATTKFDDDITVDLNKYTLTMNAEALESEETKYGYFVDANVTFINGDIDVSNVYYIEHGNFYINVDRSLAFDNVDIVADNINSFTLFFVDGALELKNKSSLEVNEAENNVIYSEEGCDVVVSESEINVDTAERVMVNVALNAEKSTITATNINDNALRNITGTINSTNIDIDGAENGIKNDGGKLTVSGTSQITITGSKEKDLVLGTDAKLEITGDKALVEVETSETPEDSVVTDSENETFISKTDLVYVQFKKIDNDADQNNGEDYDEYQIILAANSAMKINELASADLTFKFTPNAVAGGAMDYTVKAAEGVTLTQLGDSDRFMFNYNGVDKYEETGKAIVIGTVKISGYGTYSFETADVKTNAVYATEIRDNIVEGFEANGELIINDNDKFDDMDGKITGKEILVPARELTINIDFPNAVDTDNAYAYQNMTVKVSGGDLETELVVKLGDVADITNLDKFVAKKSANKAVTATANANNYVVVVTDLLSLNNSYNVEVSGAGYRTARYTVTMTEDKVLNFWNNVKDNETVVEEGKESSKKTVTFLAGDIVKDSVINIYDLSAVVSYFGEIELDENNKSEYAKYDLNRDGKIDSRDVAYVLVSWGK